MDATCECQHCGKPLEFDVQYAGQTADCPSCGAATMLALPPSQKLAKPKPEPVPRPKTQQDRAREHLEYIRENSCYGVLRAIINVASILAAIAALIGFAGYMAGGYSPSESSGLMAILVVGAFLGVLLAVVFIIALRQSALLLIDIADLLLHHQAANKD